MRAGRKGVVFFFNRANIEAAEARDTCCSRMILTRVETRGGRAQSGGGLRRLKMEARSLSRLARVFAARSRLISVSVCCATSLLACYCFARYLRGAPRAALPMVRKNGRVRVAGNSQTRRGRRETRFGAPSAYGSYSSLRKTFPGETGPCR